VCHLLLLLLPLLLLCVLCRRSIPTWSKDAHATSRQGQLTSPMPGKIIKLLVKEGATVSKGDPLLVLEAMKMEHTLTAHGDGVVEGVEGLHVGTQVEDGQELLRIVAAAAAAGKEPAVAAAS
jgi:biotin carboxyl carrier protein